MQQVDIYEMQFGFMSGRAIGLEALSRKMRACSPDEFCYVDDWHWLYVT